MPPAPARTRLLAAATCGLVLATAMAVGAGAAIGHAAGRGTDTGLAAGEGAGPGLAGGHGTGLAAGRGTDTGLAAARGTRFAGASGKRRCRHGSSGQAHRARVIWAPAFPAPAELGVVALVTSSARGSGNAVGARGCRTGRRRPAVKHGVSTAPPTSGPAGPGASGGPGNGTGPGEKSAPEGTTPPGEEGSGETPAPPSVPHVQVTAVEYHFTLSRTTVPAGKVVFNFVNSGQDEHNLNVLSGEGSLSAQFANTESDSVRNQTVEMRHGTYTLFCSLPEHESKGMKATLTVE